MKTLLLIDGNSIMNRAFYGMAANMLQTKDGLFTNALYGFLNILEKYKNEDNPTHICVAFDLRGDTFRHEIYPEYKAGRKGMPEELAQQMPILKEILDAMHIVYLEKEGYEADDILGTLSKKASIDSNEFNTVILSGDRDMLQLVSEQCTVKIPTTSAGSKTTNIFNIDSFNEEYGVSPDAFVDVKAIMGDKSDNVPGIMGIGQVGALNLIKQFHTLENIYENIDQITRPALKQKLINSKEDAFLSRELVKINRDMPIDISLDTFANKEYDKDKLLDLFSRLEFNSYIDKYGLVTEDSQDLLNNDDTETKFEKSDDDKLFINSSLLFIYYELEDEYLTLEILNEQNKVLTSQSDDTINILKNIMQSKGKIVCHDIKTLLRFCIKNNITVEREYYDTAAALYLINSTKSKYELEDVYRTTNAKASTTDIASYKIKYLYNYTYPLLKENEMEELFYTIEIPLIQVLAFMEYIGIKADKEYLVELSDYFNNELNQTAIEIFDLAGSTFNINSPKQLGIVLFEDLKLPYGKKTASGNYSTSADILENLSEFPIVEKVLYYRMISKLFSTYTQGLQSSIAFDGRIHSTFNQTVTATGRISSTDPNLQNIPIRTEIGRKIRKAFIAEKDFCIISGDYSQIELRVLAHISNDKNMIESFINKDDIHKITASQVFNIDLDDVDASQRYAAKAVNFGIVYGISDFSLAKDINVSVKEAGLYIKKYLQHYSNVQAYMHDIVEKAMENGYVSTIYGRRRYIPELSSPKYSIREFGKRVALNAPIQGSAADIMKIAMIRVYNEMRARNLKSRIILQVHDELVIEAHKTEIDQVKEIMIKEMTEGFQLLVPLDVEISVQDTLYKE